MGKPSVRYFTLLHAQLRFYAIFREKESVGDISKTVYYAPIYLLFLFLKTITPKI